MRNCIIIHGCPQSRETLIDVGNEVFFKHWIPWVKKELNNTGIVTFAPKMPTPWKPDYKKFKAKFDKEFLQLINTETILVGHSCGCAFLVHWLGEADIKINKLILVAPWKIARSGNTVKEKFYNFLINKNIIQNVNEIVYFTSDNEEINGKKSLEMYRSVLGGKVIELHNKGHYTFEETKSFAFPELVQEIL